MVHPEASIRTGALVRYADDFVCLVQDRRDAENLEKWLWERFAKFGLTLHPEKTRTISFGRYERENARRQGRKAHTFDFLGFTHYAGHSRKGSFLLGRKTSRKKFRQACRETLTWQHLNDYLTHYPLPRPRLVFWMNPPLPLWEMDRRAGCGKSARPVR